MDRTTATLHKPTPRPARWRDTGSPPPGDLPLAERVLAARGLTGEHASEFLSPKLNALHNPSGIPDIDRAAQRLLDAAEAGEPIAIYGDYDVDGCTGAAILVRTLRALDASEPITYIPHRVREGYGLHTAALEVLAERGARVVVSVDCGITAQEQARAARTLGLDLIITDHHHPPEQIEDVPDAFAVVHPRRPDSEYPFGELCGAGVAYKLAWRMLTLRSGSEKVSPPHRSLLIDLLALAAMGTVADVVPLLGENRVLTRFGLGRVPSSPFPGLPALAIASGMEPSDKVTAEDIGFKLGPRLNAAGRLSEGREALDLLITDDDAVAQTLARTLSVHNERRRKMQKQTVDQASAMVLDRGMDRDDRRAIVLAGEGWHPGVLGIVCSRLVEQFHRPAILLTQNSDGMLTGSGRSVEGFDLHGGLDACSEHLTKFGGHTAAAGLALEPDRLDGFTEAFVKHANEHLQPETLCPAVRYDCVASLEDLTPDACRILESLGPFGAAHPPPRVLLRGLRADGPPKLLGSRGDHAAVLARTKGDRRVRLLGWRMADRLSALTHGDAFDAIVEPKLNRFNGRVSVEPTIVDFRTA
ncbi:MAG: single-stranded-DNA-specific exonuclease RecJ [Planctomycetota bacterium]